MTTTPLSSLSRALGEETRELHRSAERSRTMGALLRGTLPRSSYETLLRNLHPVYRQMEESISSSRGRHPLLAWLADPRLVRADAIAGDLETLAGDRWRDRHPLLPSTEEHVRRLRRLADEWPMGLVAHGWVRYMGDLSGGQILGNLVTKHYGVGDEAVGTYDFPDIDDPDAFKEEFRRRLDDVGEGEATRIIEEARESFRLAIRMLEEVAPASPG